MESKKEETHVWVLPDSRKLLVDGYQAGVPVESCNWSESTKNWLKKVYGLDSALYEFESWDKALEFVTDFCRKHNNWGYECSSPEGDMAAQISLEDW